MKSKLIIPRIEKNTTISICTVIPFKTVELSISQDNDCTGKLDWCSRTDVRVFDIKTNEDLTEKILGGIEIHTFDGHDLMSFLKTVGEYDKVNFNKILSERIFSFIENYANTSPNWDDENGEDKFTAPDTYELLNAGNKILVGDIPLQCHSEWGSGAYSPYTSKEGKAEHDYLVSEVHKLIRQNRN